jgi:hypothetical protein
MVTPVKPLYLADIKVLKDALAHLGPYQTFLNASKNSVGEVQ